MWLFDFFRKKRKRQPFSATDIEATVTERIRITPDDELYRCIEQAVPSKNGLYPHELLMLALASDYTTQQTSFQDFWLTRYHVSRPKDLLNSLVQRGFLSVKDIRSVLERLKVAILKEELRFHGLKLCGKKSELIERLVSSVPTDQLLQRFGGGQYLRTELGNRELEQNPYILYIHLHNGYGLDIWSLNQIINRPPYLPFRDKIWGYLNGVVMEHYLHQDYKKYRNTLFLMSCLMMEQKKSEDALGLLTEVLSMDLQYLGAGDSIPSSMLSNPTSVICPDIIQSLQQIEKRLKLTPSEMKGKLLNQFELCQAHSPKEQTEIVFTEMHGKQESVLAPSYVSGFQWKMAQAV